METVISISESTLLSSTDIDYISKQFIPPDTGGGRRGVKQGWTKESKVEFAISKSLMDYGITIKKIAEIIKSLRQLGEWKGLFDNGCLKSENVLQKGCRSYLYLKDADPKKIEIMLNKKKQLFGLKEDWKDILILDVTDHILLAMPGK